MYLHSCYSQDELQKALELFYKWRFPPLPSIRFIVLAALVSVIPFYFLFHSLSATCLALIVSEVLLYSCYRSVQKDLRYEASRLGMAECTRGTLGEDGIRLSHPSKGLNIFIPWSAADTFFVHPSGLALEKDRDMVCFLPFTASCHQQKTLPLKEIEAYVQERMSRAALQPKAAPPYFRTRFFEYRVFHNVGVGDEKEKVYARCYLRPALYRCVFFVAVMVAAVALHTPPAAAFILCAVLFRAILTALLHNRKKGFLLKQEMKRKPSKSRERSAQYRPGRRAALVCYPDGRRYIFRKDLLHELVNYDGALLACFDNGMTVQLPMESLSTSFADIKCRNYFSRSYLYSVIGYFDVCFLLILYDVLYTAPHFLDTEVLPKTDVP